MTEAFLTAGFTAAAFLITLSRAIGLKTVIKYGTFIDISFTILLAMLFNGTYSGMMTAVLGGLFIAVFLSIAKKAQTIKLTTEA